MAFTSPTSNSNTRNSVKPSPKAYIPPYARADCWRPSSSADHYRPSDSLRRSELLRHPDYARYTDSMRNYPYSASSYDREWRYGHSSSSTPYSYARGSAGEQDNTRRMGFSRDPRPTDMRVMPKHFNQPLTCFYWATQGDCRKTDDECWYAHFDTGVVAGAPVKLDQPNKKRSFKEFADDNYSVNNASHAVAGAKATEAIEDHARREQLLRSRESAQIARERDVAMNEEAIETSAANLKEVISAVFLMLEKVDQTTKYTLAALESGRGIIAKKITEPMDEADATDRIDFSEDEEHTGLNVQTSFLSAIDCAITAMVDLEKDMVDIKKHMETKVGTFKSDAVD